MFRELCLVTLLKRSKIYIHHDIGLTEFHVSGPPVSAMQPSPIWLHYSTVSRLHLDLKWDKKVKGNLQGTQVKIKEKTSMLLCSAKFQVTHSKREWLYVAAVWPSSSAGWSALRYFTLCICFWATLHFVELRALSVPC